MNSKISVFGSTGFIGSEFCKKYKKDIIEIEKNDFFPKSDTLLYLISTVDNYNIFTSSTLDIDTNLIYLMKVLENCKNKNIKFNFISSWYVYGNVDLPAREDSNCNPKGFYSITKYAAEMLVESFCNTFNIDYTIIRLGNVIGGRDKKASKKKNAFHFLLNELKNNSEISLYNDGKFYRDFISINDTVEGLNFLIKNGENKQIYNLSTGVPVLFCDAINYAYKKLKSTSNIKNMEPTNFHKIVQTESMHLDISKIRKLGFLPKENIQQIIDNLISDFNLN
jgi:nucleoside-diphosphate-sugar epimerase